MDLTCALTTFKIAISGGARLLSGHATNLLASGYQFISRAMAAGHALTTTPKTMNEPTPQLIAAVITEAAAARGFPGEELLSEELAKQDQYIRARLLALAVHRLHHYHSGSRKWLARATRATEGATAQRIKSAAKLIRDDPKWRKIYMTLP
jgi:hypothetical protein